MLRFPVLFITTITVCGVMGHVEHVWEQGVRVGLTSEISPTHEMGKRFGTYAFFLKSPRHGRRAQIPTSTPESQTVSPVTDGAVNVASAWSPSATVDGFNIGAAASSDGNASKSPDTSTTLQGDRIPGMTGTRGRTVGVKPRPLMNPFHIPVPLVLEGRISCSSFYSRRNCVNTPAH